MSTEQKKFDSRSHQAEKYGRIGSWILLKFFRLQEEERQKRLTTIDQFVRQTAQEPEWPYLAVAVFGSLVRGEAHILSDIDILCLASPHNRNLGPFYPRDFCRRIATRIGSRVELLSRAPADPNSELEAIKAGQHPDIGPNFYLIDLTTRPADPADIVPGVK